MSTSSTPISFPQMGRFHDLLKKKGIDGPLFQAGFLESGLLSDLAEVIAAGQTPDRDKFREYLGMEPLELRFFVSYRRPIVDLANMAKIDYVDSGPISWNRFPWSMQQNREVVAKLALAPSDQTERLLHAIFSDGYRDATLEELLAFARAFPGVQRRVTVLACGTSAHYRGKNYLAALDEYHLAFPDRKDPVRRIKVIPRSALWRDHVRFLMIRDSKDKVIPTEKQPSTK